VGFAVVSAFATFVVVEVKATNRPGNPRARTG
jgi:hypothetical protein